MNQRVEGGPLVSNVDLPDLHHQRLRVAISPNSGSAPVIRTALGPIITASPTSVWTGRGLLYVNGGSRTDEETGDDVHLGKMGEGRHGRLWRLDPELPDPRWKWSPRIRSTYSFNWDPAGRTFRGAMDPTPMRARKWTWSFPRHPASRREHHGFPYQLGRQPAAEKWYPHTPPAPAGLSFVLPVENLGPDGWQGPGPGSTFDPHSSPAGLLWLGDDFPATARQAFVMGRFGNLIRTGNGDDSGFDLLLVRPRQRLDGTWEAKVNTLLAPLGRPIDVLRAGPGRLLVLEYTRPTNFKDQVGWLPGRILELSSAAPSR